MSPGTVLLSSPPDSTGGELRRMAAAAGFAVSDHLLGSAPAVDFAPLAVAVVEVGSRAEAAAAQTRRWRAELGDQFVPVLWVASPEHAALGLEAGADAVLPWPVEPELFAAQLRAMARAHASASRVAARAGESRILGDQLRKALAQLEREHELARHVRATFLPERLPEVGAVRFHVCDRARGRSGGDFHSVRRLDEDHVGFLVGDVVGTAAPGGLLGIFVQQVAAMKEITEPGEVLTAVNRRLLGLGMDDLPLVALLVGVLNAHTGVITLARAGFPAAVYVPANGPPAVWSVPGPFLGTADTKYEEFRATLSPGDRLLIGTDGTRPDGAPAPTNEGLLEAATKYRDRAGPAFVDAVARELLHHVRHADDFTLMGVERGSDTRSC
jgi:hypothetical protein